MISSQVTAMCQSSIPSALLHSSIASSTAMLRSTGTLPRRSRPRHQIRTLRIGLWSSYLDPEFQKEVQRRHRIMKHKYMEAVNRKLSWERHDIVSPRHFGVKGFMCSAWRGQDARFGREWGDVDQMSKSRGIEDVEQNAFDKLFDSKDGLYDRVRARSRNWFLSASNAINAVDSSSKVVNDSPRRTVYGQEDFQRRFQHFQSQQALVSEEEYVIDPITNRKVFKNKTSETTRKPIEVPVKTFKGYRSQFQNFTPSASKATESTSSFIIEEGLGEYDKKAGYGPVLYNEPDGKLPEKPDTVRESLKEYEQKNPVGPVVYREPDGKLPEVPDSVRESLKEYERKHPVGAIGYREPNGTLPEKPCPVQESLKYYDDKVTYGSVAHNCSEGVSRLESSQSTIDESCKPAKSKHCPVQEGLKAYDRKVIYGQAMHNDSDGQARVEQDPVAEGLRAYDERQLYSTTPRRILKNISLSSGDGETDKSFRYPNEDQREDLDLLRPSDVRAASGIMKITKKETEAEKIATRGRLENDFQKQQDAYSSTCEHLASVINVTKLKSRPQSQREFEAWARAETSELKNIQAHLRGRVNAQLANVSAELSKATEPEVTGHLVRDYPEEFETRWTAAQDSESLKPENDVISKDIEAAPEKSFSRDWNTPRLQTSLDRAAAFKRKEIDEEVRLQNERDPYSKIPQGLETSYAIEKAEQAKLQNERDPYSKKPMGMETSFSDEIARKRALELERDPYSRVPQGLETSYIEEVKLQNEMDPYSKKPMGLETSYADEVAARQAEGDLSVSVSSFGKRNDDEQSKRARQLAKQEKKNKFKQMDKDLIQEIRSIYEEQYGILDTKHRQNPEDSATSKPVLDSQSQPQVSPLSDRQDPTVYKILAYDPIMQEINTAETTSIVEDTASALTPAEVLLRLSNPAKFFPHFQPLQSEGYEIISGSGDVLVFRKVRAAGSYGSKSKSATSIQFRKTVNPIDGMQSSPAVATGNFASPTGFVNHDLPVSEPPFKSNIDVRREESVFSGKSNWKEESESSNGKTKGRGKRLLIGAAWVAGCSYAIGVVTEFFRTGGIDGLGPQGF